MSDASDEILVRDGGCHCGAVRFRVSIRSRTVSECNCSICRKKGALHLVVPEADFTLLSGHEQLTTYTFNTHVAKHLFCRCCGIHSFGRPRSAPDKINVNWRCLDQDGLPEFSLSTFDGQNWEQTMAARQKP